MLFRSAAEGAGSKVKRAVRAGKKEWISLASYLVAVLGAFVSPYAAIAIYVAVAVMWLIPDRRFERQR